VANRSPGVVDDWLWNRFGTAGSDDDAGASPTVDIDSQRFELIAGQFECRFSIEIRMNSKRRIPPRI